MKKVLKIVAILLVPILIALLPTSWMPLENLTTTEHRVIALFVMAALFWILEPIPIYATSILIIVLELVVLSDKGIVWLKGEGDDFGILMSYKEIMATMASPIILLFLGGFFLAMAATKYRLDQNLARVLLSPFGNKPQWVMMGLMLITAIFSMFMSNTATTAMMLSLLVPVLASFESGSKIRTAFALSIPMAANIGGIGTPIGTPPNALALKYLNGSDYISFGQWMSFGVPFVLVALIISWVLILFFYPMKNIEINLSIKGKFLKTPKALIVYATFILTVLLWLTDFIHGMNSYVVAMIPVAVFLSFNIITKEDIKKISWDVLWLVSGGIALGLALDKTGLAAHIINAIPFGELSAYLVIALASFVAALMANFMSNTATANLLLPLIAALGTSMPALQDLGGSKVIILGVALSASLGLALPISTPPNALAHATGEIETKDMAKLGVIMCFIGLGLVFLLLTILKLVNFV
ncbi:MAG: SLC13/DASS family transporter [Cyclobacteriaceae bacterium]|nr:SLC13/DASS family transporter [Cyclobacteriaceae bacterium]